MQYIVLFFILQGNILCLALKTCDNGSFSNELCSLDGSYAKQNPDGSPGNPAKIDQSITFISVTNFDEKESTLGLEVIVKVIWNDTRVFWKPEDEK